MWQEWVGKDESIVVAEWKDALRVLAIQRLSTCAHVNVMEQCG